MPGTTDLDNYASGNELPDEGPWQPHNFDSQSVDQLFDEVTEGLDWRVRVLKQYLADPFPEDEKERMRKVLRAFSQIREQINH